jgi:hypothetical protein
MIFLALFTLQPMQIKVLHKLRIQDMEVCIGHWTASIKKGSLANLLNCLWIFPIFMYLEGLEEIM